ncbi:MAG: hypothetical protein ACYTXT_31345 [Nostoc sp.]
MKPEAWKDVYQERQRAGGRRQKGMLQQSSACDQRRTCGLKPRRLHGANNIGRGLNPRPNCSFCLLPSASCLLQQLSAIYKESEMYPITGITGQVGGAVARKLLSDNQSVCAVIREEGNCLGRAGLCSCPGGHERC